MCIAYAERLVPLLQHARSAHAAAKANAAAPEPSGLVAIEEILIHVLSHLGPAGKRKWSPYIPVVRSHL